MKAERAKSNDWNWMSRMNLNLKSDMNSFCRCWSSNLLSSLSTMQYLIAVFSRSSSRINLSRKRFFICAWDTYDTWNGQAEFTWQLQLHFAPAVCLIITNLCRLVNSRRQHEWISTAMRKCLGRRGRLMNFRSYMCICQKRTELFVVWNSSSKWLKSL